MTDVILILTTVPSVESGEEIARSLVAERLAACVNMIPGLKSFYQWKGELIAEEEVQLLIKTTGPMFHRLNLRLKELHSYELPEVIVLTVTDGSEAYLKWVRSETTAQISQL